MKRLLVLCQYLAPQETSCEYLTLEAQLLGRYVPKGVAVEGDDNILVVDCGKQRLLKFSHGGDLIAAVGTFGDGPGQFNKPTNVCINSVNGIGVCG